MNGAEFSLDRLSVSLDLRQTTFTCDLLAHRLFHPPGHVQNPQQQYLVFSVEAVEDLVELVGLIHANLRSW